MSMGATGNALQQAFAPHKSSQLAVFTHFGLAAEQRRMSQTRGATREETSREPLPRLERVKPWAIILAQLE